MTPEDQNIDFQIPGESDDEGFLPEPRSKHTGRVAGDVGSFSAIAGEVPTATGTSRVPQSAAGTEVGVMTSPTNFGSLFDVLANHDFDNLSREEFLKKVHTTNEVIFENMQMGCGISCVRW